MNFFLVESPLQLLNAKEAKHKFNIVPKDSVLLVFGGVSQKNMSQIKKIVLENEWQDVFYLRSTQGSLSRYLNIPSLKSIQKKYSTHEKIFIGEYRSDLMRHFIHKSNCNEFFLLDDGNYSLILHKLIRNEQGYRNKLTNRRKFLNYIFGIDDQDLFDITFFTIYTDKAKEPYVVNNYDFIKSQIRAFNKTEKIFFIGNNTPELDILSERTYFEYLNKVNNYYKGRAIFYIPHRRESSKKVSKIQDKFGFNILNFEMPIEWAILKSKELPSEIVSFFSSALDNCYLVYGEQINIKAFKMPSNVIADSRKDLFEMNFQRYEKYKNNFKIVEL